MTDSKAHPRRAVIVAGMAVLAGVAMLMLVLSPNVGAAKKTPTVQFKSGSYSVMENQSPAQIAITRNPKGDGSVKFNTAGGTATAGPDCTDPNTDYVAVSPPVTVPFSNQSQVNTPVVICNNNSLNEGTETVVLQLSQPSAGLSLGNGKSEVTLNIQDDDPAPSLSINNRSGTEGDSRNFTVTASAPSALPMQVTLTAVSDTATVGAGQDAEPQSVNVAIPAGSTTETAQFTSNQDTIDEPTEKYLVNMSAPVNASIGDGSGDFTLLDDDAAPNASISDASATEDGGTITFNVTLDGPAAQTATVDWQTAVLGTATSDPTDCSDPATDYVSADGTVTFLQGDQSENVVIELCGDLDPEDYETLFVFLGPSTYVGIDDGGAQGTIENDDAPAFSINDPAAVDEDVGPVTFTVTLDHQFNGTLTVDWDTVDLGPGAGFADGGATCPVDTSLGTPDYLSGSGTLTFGPGDTSETLDVTTCTDIAGDPDETFSVVLSGQSAGTLADDTGIGTLTD